jgi:transposase
VTYAAARSGSSTAAAARPATRIRDQAPGGEEPGEPARRAIREDHRNARCHRPGQHIALAWIGKEKLRHALNACARVTGSVPCERQVRDRLFSFYDWCAHNEQATKLTTLAATIARWEDQIVTTVLSGVTNARSESLNRIAKLEARHAYGFRNPANQRRRVRTVCTAEPGEKTRNRLQARHKQQSGNSTPPVNFEEPIKGR